MPLKRCPKCDRRVGTATVLCVCGHVFYVRRAKATARLAPSGTVIDATTYDTILAFMHRARELYKQELALTCAVERLAGESDWVFDAVTGAISIPELLQKLKLIRGRDEEQSTPLAPPTIDLRHPLQRFGVHP